MILGYCLRNKNEISNFVLSKKKCNFDFDKVFVLCFQDKFSFFICIL